MTTEDMTAPPLSILFAPGDSQRKIERAFSSNAVAVCLDLEDAVAPTAKEVARKTVVSFLQENPALRRRALVRINADALNDDLGALKPVLPDLFAIMVPKATVEQITTLPKMKIFAVVEDPKGLSEAQDIAAIETVVGLGLGIYDFSASLGADPHHESMNFPRYLLRAAASAHGKLAFDAPYANFKDEAGLTHRAAWGRACGYDGMLAIHPAQIATIHTVYFPTDVEIAAATEIVEAFKASGGGAANVNGRMIDKPVFVRAQKILHRANLI